MWINLIRLHLKYIFNKTKIILIIGILVIVAVTLLVSVHPFESSSLRWSNRLMYAREYFGTMFIITKVIITLFGCYLFANSFTKENDEYLILIFPYMKNIAINYISKMITIIISQSVILIVTFVIYLLLGIIFLPGFSIDHSLLELFIVIYLVCQCYGFISFMFVRLFNTNISFIIGYILFTISEMIGSDTIGNNILSIFLPSYKYLDDYVIYSGIVPLTLINILYLIIGMFIYQNE